MINRIKITLLLLTILLFIIPIEAQVQHGYVKAKGRIDNIGNTIAGKRLPGTTIKVDGHYIVSHESGNFSAQVRKSVDGPSGMLTEDHHHTVHEERQVCYSSHLRPKSLHL